MDEKRTKESRIKELKVGDVVSVQAETIRRSIGTNPSLRGENVPDGTYQGRIQILEGGQAKILFDNIGGGEITYVIPISEL